MFEGLAGRAEEAAQCLHDFRVGAPCHRQGREPNLLGARDRQAPRRDVGSNVK